MPNSTAGLRLAALGIDMNRPRDRRGAGILALLLAAAALAPAVGAEKRPAAAVVRPSRPPSRLRVSDNGRALVTEDGAPFFWLGDTSWHTMTKAVREDGGDQPSVGRYLDTRAAQGFSVIQTVILPPDSRKGKAYGHRPFADSECSQPLAADGPLNDFWDMTDWLVDAAGARRWAMLYIPDGRPIRVRSERLPGPAVDAFRFDPRTSRWSVDDKESVVRKPFASGLASGPGAAPREFAPPGGPGEGNDWVLVLEAGTR